MSRERLAPAAVLCALLLSGLLLYAWNLATLPPFGGYDDDGHLHYVATLLEDGRLPHPLEGWSTFHPPLYYALVALLSQGSAPVWQPARIGALSALAILAVAGLAFLSIRRLGHPLAGAAVAAALLLFTPCVQLAATMIGNEALAAGFCALALTGLLRLQRDPRDLRAAALVGVSLGLALATKGSALIVAAAAPVPFLRRGLDRGCLRAAALCAGLLLLLAGPVYLRNLALTGNLLPMTRGRPLVALNEQRLTIRERRATDYLWLDPAVLSNPLVPATGAPRGLNPHMTNVWGLAYASTWFDAHALRVSRLDRETAQGLGRWLLALGLVPTGLMLTGFGLALRELATKGSASREAPLTVAFGAGLLAFVAFTARVPTTAAVKGAYLLPVALPAAVFFARGVATLPPLARGVALLGSSLAAAAAALAFTNGVLLPVAGEAERARTHASPRLAAVAETLDAASAGRWRRIQAQPTPAGVLVWRLEAFGYAPVTAARLAHWCGYVESAMQHHLPGRRWQAVFEQAPEPRPDGRLPAAAGPWSCP